MTRAQIQTIIITVILTVTFRELLTWVVSFIKALPVIGKIKEKAGWLFGEGNRALLWNCFWFALIAGQLIFALREQGPVTRWDVFKIVMFTVSLFVWVFMWMVDIASARIRRRLEMLSGESTPKT